MNNLAEQLIFEDKGGKNLHLEHIEDEILNYGVDGGRASINFVRSLRDMFAGATRSSINMTVKWDGAPAIFAGIDPEDGKFFEPAGLESFSWLQMLLLLNNKLIQILTLLHIRKF